MAFEDMFRITPPRCDVSRCRRNGTLRLQATHPKMPVQRANICAKHLPEMLALVKGQGYDVKIDGSDA